MALAMAAKTVTKPATAMRTAGELLGETTLGRTVAVTVGAAVDKVDNVAAVDWVA